MGDTPAARQQLVLVGASVLALYAIWAAVDLWVLHHGGSQLSILLFAFDTSVGLIQCAVLAVWIHPGAMFLTNLTRERRYLRHGSPSRLFFLAGLAAATLAMAIIGLLAPETEAAVTGYASGFGISFGLIVWYSYLRQRQIAAGP